MAIVTGTHLGPYKILSMIGAGGMGEVYRAQDPRLGREVAIKVLPPQLSADEVRLRRFEQEARAAGVLNHPNIVSVHDIGKENEIVYIVTELLTGETLREALGGSALPMRKTVEYGLQIAHGLAAAHERGIVHRDLKPENIFITNDGRAKILDFGLAKLSAPEPPTEEQSKMQTADPGTQPGVVLGTVGYMSPEQVRGHAADHRSDIFTFGLILYEMLTGKRAFQRGSTADTMSAILKEDPPEFEQTNRAVSPSLERIIRHCLEKNPAVRFQSARDLAFDLEMISGTSQSSTAQTAIAPSARKSLRYAAMILLILVGLISAFFAGRQSRTNPVIQKQAALPESGYKRITFRRGFISAARFTPDGQSIVYSAAWVGSPEEVFVTRPQNPVSRSLGISKAALLSISNSGEMAILLNPEYRNGWERAGTLARAPIDGGAPREMLEEVQDADWAPNGKDLAVAHRVNGRYRLEFPIGKVLYETGGWINNVRVSPAADQIAFMDHTNGGDDRGTVAIVDLKGAVKHPTQEFASESGLHWSRDGKEIWFTASREGSNEQPLFAVTPEGKLRMVTAMVGNLILHDIDANGTVLLTRDSRRREIILLPPGETRERDMSWFDWSFSRYLSDDGKLLVFEEQGAGGGPNYSVFIRKTDGSPAVRLGDGFAGAMSPDGAWVISRLPNDTSRYTLLPTGAGQNRVLICKPLLLDATVTRWFADGKRILFPAHQEGRPTRWWVRELQSERVLPVTPEGTAIFPALIALDQSSVLASFPDGGYAFYPISGGPPKEVQGLENAVPIQWTADGREVYAISNAEIPLRVFRVNLNTGQQTLWKEVTPSDQSGIAGRINMLITPDGNSYAYTYRRVLSDLYLVPGLQ